jgi:hypothetical protein
MVRKGFFVVSRRPCRHRCLSFKPRASPHCRGSIPVELGRLSELAWPRQAFYNDDGYIATPFESRVPPSCSGPTPTELGHFLGGAALGLRLSTIIIFYHQLQRQGLGSRWPRRETKDRTPRFREHVHFQHNNTAPAAPFRHLSLPFNMASALQAPFLSPMGTHPNRIREEPPPRFVFLVGHLRVLGVGSGRCVGGGARLYPAAGSNDVMVEMAGGDQFQMILKHSSLL